MAFTKILGPGIATDTNVQVGILTATKYFGDGSSLTGILNNTISTPINTTSPQFIGFSSVSSGANTSIGISSTFVFIPSSGNVGIGTTNPTSKLTITGDVLVSGVITATTFVGALTGTASSTTNIPNLTGDITSVNKDTTLATVNSNVGTFGSGGAIPTITVNAKGLVIGVTTTAINPANDGTLTLAVSGTGLSGSASFTANQSGPSSFTVTSNATSANTVSTIVARDASGNFSANTITASLTGTASSTTNIPNLTGAITSVNTTTSLGSFTSAQLATALTDETGSGSAVFATSPTLVTPVLGNATASSLNVSGISTFTNGPILVGTATSTGTASQTLQVTGGAYVSGSVGIGTINPTARLNLYDTAGSAAWRFRIGTNVSDGAGFYQRANGDFEMVLRDASNNNNYILGSSGNLSLRPTSNVLINTDTPTGTSSQPLQVTGGAYVSGNLGVGITNPTQTLHVQGSARVTGAVYDFNNAAGSTGQILQSVGTGVSWTTLSGGATLTNDTTTNASYYPTFSSATSGTYSTAYVSNTKCTFNPSTGTLSATQFTSLSDANKKKNIRPIENAIEITKKLEGVRFDWKDNDAPSIGVIAQEVEKVLPELVIENDGIKSVSYGNIVGVLIEAIKEQQVRIEELERKLNA